VFQVNHDEDSQQQSFSLLELECGVTAGDQPTLSIVWKDAQTFTDEQVLKVYEYSLDEAHPVRFGP